jgi:hypothetical protein
MAGQPGLLHRDLKLKVLSAAGDPLGRLSPVVGFKIFCGELEVVLRP